MLTVAEEGVNDYYFIIEGSSTGSQGQVSD
jgi:hypothetical protein